MTQGQILQLYPTGPDHVSLKGLYLSHDLRATAPEDRPFVYSNYITSLDGRIAVPHRSRPGLVVPDSIANDRDWRLFQELAIQTDILITSGRYLRDYEDGRAQEILRVYDDPRFADLAEWRAARGLSRQPDILVISRSLDFPIPEPLRSGGRRVHVATVENTDPDRLETLRKEAEIVIAGKEGVEGDVLVHELHRRGYRLMFNATGPKVLHLLLSADQLHRLYLTHAGKMLGGMPYSTILEGDLLEQPAGFQLNTLYFDPVALDGLGQLFLSYDRV